MTENYTAEDFAQASFARHETRGLATRDGGVHRDLWMDIDGVERDDMGMVRDGWVPVVESRVADHTLRHVEERAERKRQKLIAHIESVEAAVRDRNRTIEELYVARQEASRRESAAHDRVVTLLDTKATLERTVYELRHDLKVALAEVADLGDENDRLERILQAPLSLKDLEVAWENAEVPTSPDFRDEDVVIVRNDSGLGGYFVRHAHDTIDLELWAEGAVRYLHRAPREPWADLADIIGRYDGDSDSPAGLARFLHENEVTTPFDRDAGRVTGGDE